MKFHQGRLLDHVHLRVRELEASRRFYRAVTDALGIPFGRESQSSFFGRRALRQRRPQAHGRHPPRVPGT